MSVFLAEQLITRYSQIALSDNAITINKTRLTNETLLKLFQESVLIEAFFTLGAITIN